MNKLTISRTGVLFLIFYILPTGLSAQLLENSLFRIYRAEFILGTVSQIRFNADNSYELKIVEIHCSLCDHKELNKLIESKGHWEQRNDTIYLDKNRKLLTIGSNILKPLFVIGISSEIDSNPQFKQRERSIIESEINQFHLIYDTYPNGVAKLVVDRYRFSTEEYEVELEPNGKVKSIKRFHNGKQRKRIK